MSETVSKYAAQEYREIRSLSQSDILELNRGGGWGFAKSAELNGFPGPSHVLEMKETLQLDEQQVSQITVIFKQMKNRAIYISKEFLTVERNLDHLFQNGMISETKLKELLAMSSKARRELRYIHLAAHLETSRLLNDEQIQSYNVARGYGVSGRCKVIPKGHDADLWRKHNGCSKPN